MAKGEKRAEEGVRIDRFESFRRDIESATKFSFRSNLKTLIFESVYAIPIFRQNRFIDPYKRINSCNKAKNSKNQTVLFFLPPINICRNYRQVFLPSFFFLHAAIFKSPRMYSKRRGRLCMCMCVRVRVNSTQRLKNSRTR